MSDTRSSLEYKYLYLENPMPNRKIEEEDKDDEDRGVIVIDIFDNNTEVDSL